MAEATGPLDRVRGQSTGAEAVHRRPAGARIIVPGYPQWAWRQRDRALVLFGSYAVALLVGAFTWGTATGLAVLAFAFATHAASAADAIRQAAFPGLGRLVPGFTAAAGLGAICYGPALAMASVLAWPVTPEERPREGYLVNRWAYREGGDPVPGETIWLRPARGARPRIARVVAGPGQRLEWSAGRLRVDDREVEGSPFRASGSPGELALTVPEGHVLVSFAVDPAASRSMPGGWEIVDRADVQGRAWALSYPIGSRRLLRLWPTGPGHFGYPGGLHGDRPASALLGWMIHAKAALGPPWRVIPALPKRDSGSDMDRLWAPWRAQYITDSSGKPPSGDSACFLCRGLAAEPAEDRENLLAWRGANSAVFLNRYPYNNGHLLVAPVVHRGSLAELDGRDLAEPLETVRRVIGVLDRMLRPECYNVGLNLGKSAGAGLPGHLHWHIVPRWDGDTNFMPVLGQTKVIVESLFDFYDRLVAELASEG